MTVISADVEKPTSNTRDTAQAVVAASAELRSDVVLDCHVEKIHYGDFLAVRDSVVPIENRRITGFIGPSGCVARVQCCEASIE